MRGQFPREYILDLRPHKTTYKSKEKKAQIQVTWGHQQHQGDLPHHIAKEDPNSAAVV